MKVTEIQEGWRKKGWGILPIESTAKLTQVLEAFLAEAQGECEADELGARPCHDSGRSMTFCPYCGGKIKEKTDG